MTNRNSIPKKALSLLLSALMVVSCLTVLFPTLVKVMEEEGLLPSAEAANPSAKNHFRAFRTRRPASAVCFL